MHLYPTCTWTSEFNIDSVCGDSTLIETWLLPSLVLHTYQLNNEAPWLWFIINMEKNIDCIKRKQLSGLIENHSRNNLAVRYMYVWLGIEIKSGCWSPDQVSLDIHPAILSISTRFRFQLTKHTNFKIRSWNYFMTSITWLVNSIFHKYSLLMGDIKTESPVKIFFGWILPICKCFFYLFSIYCLILYWSKLCMYHYWLFIHLFIY